MTIRMRAMDTDVSVLVPNVDAIAEHAFGVSVARVFAQADRTFSRFRPDSELSRLNASRGPLRVSGELFIALQRARAYWEMTDGWFDPAIAPALCAAGYDRSFSYGTFDRAAPLAPPRRHIGFDRVELDPKTRSVWLPPGAALDCGGFIKGWTVDRASALLPAPSAVNAGGDAALRGAGPTDDGWLVDVEDPRNGTSLMCLEARDRGVATSATNRRAWRLGGRAAHHLIDPRTGVPARSDLAQVTVMAASVEYADVLAKTALLRGSRAGRRFLDGCPGVSAVLVLDNGRVQFTGEAIAQRTVRDIFSVRN